MRPNNEQHDDGCTVDIGPTLFSIAAALAAQQREREEFFRTTGIQLTSDGRVPRPLTRVH